MNIIFVGAPGAGKGTHAKKLSEMLNIPHISTGDIFRDNISQQTELGIVADKYISKGMLVPDEITMSIVKDRLSKEDCDDGFILDGFPRTLVQAEELDNFLDGKNRKVDYVVNILVEEDVLIQRLLSRRVCSQCKSTFSLSQTCVKNDTCPKCGGKLVKRDDDKIEIIKERFISYHNQTEPLLNYYAARKILRNAKGMESYEQTLKNILEAIDITK